MALVWGQEHNEWFVVSANQLVTCGEAISFILLFPKLSVCLLVSSQLNFPVLNPVNAVTDCLAVSCFDNFNHRPGQLAHVIN